MDSLTAYLGIKTYSFRSIPANPDVAAAVKECGVRTADLPFSHNSAPALA